MTTPRNLESQRTGERPQRAPVGACLALPTVIATRGFQAIKTSALITAGSPVPLRQMPAPLGVSQSGHKARRWLSPQLHPVVCPPVCPPSFPFSPHLPVLRTKLRPCVPWVHPPPPSYTPATARGHMVPVPEPNQLQKSQGWSLSLVTAGLQSWASECRV